MTRTWCQNTLVVFLKCFSHIEQRLFNFCQTTECLASYLLCHFSKWYCFEKLSFPRSTSVLRDTSSVPVYASPRRNKVLVFYCFCIGCRAMWFYFLCNPSAAERKLWFITIQDSPDMILLKFSQFRDRQKAAVASNKRDS